MTLKAKLRYVAVAGALLVVHAQQAIAQDHVVFNNYGAYQGVLNPAYNGSRDVISALAVFRSQWTGFKGAPFTGALNVHGPIDKNKNLGFGVVIQNDHSGFTNDLEFFAAAAYRIKVNKKMDCRLGLQVGFKNVIYNANKAVTVDYGDPVFDGRISKFGFNFGFGAMLYSKDFFIGLAIPRFFANKYNSDKQEIKNAVSGKELHMFLYGGYIFTVDDYKIKPAALFRFLPGAPLTVDISFSMLFAKKLWVGLQYRTITDIIVFADFQINQCWGVKYSFDFPLNDLKKYTVAGSHEIGLTYDFQLKRRPGMRSIRYF